MSFFISSVTLGEHDLLSVEFGDDAAGELLEQSFELGGLLHMELVGPGVVLDQLCIRALLLELLSERVRRLRLVELVELIWREDRFGIDLKAGSVIALGKFISLGLTDFVLHLEEFLDVHHRGVVHLPVIRRLILSINDLSGLTAWRSREGALQDAVTDFWSTSEERCLFLLVVSLVSEALL